MFPEFPDGLGVAPKWLCARLLDDGPCGDHAEWHIIWDVQGNNGPVCDDHMDEAVEAWVFFDAHPYSAACGTEGSLFSQSALVCYIEGEN